MSSYEEGLLDQKEICPFKDSKEYLDQDYSLASDLEWLTDMYKDEWYYKEIPSSFIGLDSCLEDNSL